MFHVDHNEVIASEAGDLGEGWGKAEEEEAVEGFTAMETGFEALGSGGGGDGREIWGGGGGVCRGFKRR